MTLLPFTDCCLLLGVDPKTLRLWLKAAHLSCTSHPTDARLKCLTPSQLHHLADLHGRCLPDPLPGQTGQLLPSPSSSPPTAQAVSPLPGGAGDSAATLSPDAQLRHQLTLLQAQVAALQEHVTELALALLREREYRWQERSSHPGSPLPAALPSSPPAPPAPPARLPSVAQPAALPVPDRPRARSRALPLIELGADGTYVVISPTQGVLPLVPDSPAWFDWLSSLTAFTFQGTQGRFSATRKTRQGKPLQAWNVHRCLHGRSCTLYLAMSSPLTLARLEDMAAAVSARLTTL